MRVKTALLLSLLLAAGPVFAAPSNLAATLRVTIDGLNPAGGTLRVSLHDEATFSLPGALPLRRQDVPNAAGAVAVQLDRIPPGDYVLRVFQDLNNDGIWQPGEPQGGSGDAGKDFDKAAVSIKSGANDTTIHLR